MNAQRAAVGAGPISQKAVASAAPRSSRLTMAVVYHSHFRLPVRLTSPAEAICNAMVTEHAHDSRPHCQ